MKEVRIKSKFGFSLSGEIEAFIVTAGGMTRWFTTHNMIADSAVDIMLGFFARDLDNKMISYVDIGTGGDINPATGLDTGARVAPQEDETKIRQLLFRAPIANVETNSSSKEVVFTAIAKPESANSALINEFTLLSYDGTLLAHFVTPEDPLTGRAYRYEKTALMYLVVRWTMTPELRRS